MQFNIGQKRIINSRPNGHTLIKGAKGTGKTTAAINKIQTLIKSYCIRDDDRVIMVAYNEESSNYASFIYNNIDYEKYHQSSFFDEDNSNKFEIKTVDDLLFYYFNKYKKKHKIHVEIANAIECENELKEAINTIAKKYEKLNLINIKYMNFIKKEISWIKSCNYMKLEEYQIADRSGRVSKSIDDSPKILRKNSKQRQSIYDTLVEYNNNLKKINKIDKQDVALLALQEGNKKKNKKYTHILIDDSQNLTKVQLEFLKSIYDEKTYSSITFILEDTKSINSEAWLTKGKSFVNLGYDMKGKCISLRKSYNEDVKVTLKNDEIFKTKEIGHLNNKTNIIKPKRKANKNHKASKVNNNNDKLIQEDFITLGLINNKTENQNIINETLNEVKNMQDFDKFKDTKVDIFKDKQNIYGNSFALENIQYIDLKRNVSHMFVKDTSSIGEIYIEDSGVDKIVEDVIALPVFNEIAAGNPILMNDAIEDSYYLPKEWIRTSRDIFMLKIKGDSMVNKNINDGDYVVISKQNTASIGEIVAVDIDGEATLKTYKTKFGRVALTPENDAYEPIIIEDQQFYILGVAIGIVKDQM